MSELPAPLPEKLKAFLDAGKTGNLQLDIRDGKIVSFKLTESGTVDKVPKYALR